MFLRFMFYFDKKGEFNGTPWSTRNLMCALYNESDNKAIGYEILKYNPKKQTEIFSTETFESFIECDRPFKASYDKYGKLSGVAYVD